MLYILKCDIFSISIDKHLVMERKLLYPLRCIQIKKAFFIYIFPEGTMNKQLKVNLLFY